MNIFKAIGDTISNHKKYNCDCERIIFTDSTSLPLKNGDHKFCEIISFIDIISYCDWN